MLLFKLDAKTKKSNPQEVLSTTNEVLKPYFDTYEASKEVEFLLKSLLSMHKKTSNENVEGVLSLENLLNSYPMLKIDAAELFRKVRRALVIAEGMNVCQRWVIIEFVNQWLDKDYYVRELLKPVSTQKSALYWLNKKIIPLIEEYSPYQASCLRQKIAFILSLTPSPIQSEEVAWNNT